MPKWPQLHPYRKVKPGLATPLDYGNPVVSDLFWHINCESLTGPGRYNLYEQVHGHILAARGTYTGDPRVDTPWGVAIQEHIFSGLSHQAANAWSPHVTVPFTMLLVHADGNFGDKYWVSINNNSSTAGIAIQPLSNGRIQLRGDQPSDNAISGNGHWTADVYAAHVVSCDGENKECRFVSRDLASDAYSVSSDTWGNPTTLTGLVDFDLASAINEYTHTLYIQFSFWSRSMSYGEMIDLANHPFQIYEPEPAGIVSIPPAGGADTNISPPAGTLTLSTTAPIDPMVAHLRAPGVGDLTLSTTAPIDPMVDHARAPGVVDLTLTTTAPTRLYAHQRDTGAGDLVLSTTAPSLGAGITITPAAANLTLSTTAPVDPMVDHARTPATVNLTLTTTAPSDQMVAHLRTPAAADLTLSSVAPTRLYAHQRDTTTGNLTLTTTAPTLGTSISIIPASANLTLSTVAPTKTLDHNRAGAAGDLTLSSVAPARVNASQRTTTTGNLTLTTTAPSDPVLDHTRTPTAADLTLSTTAPTRLFEHLRTVTAGDLTLTTTAPTRQLGVVTALGVMTWSVSYENRTWGVIFGNRTFDVPYDELGD